MRTAHWESSFGVRHALHVIAWRVEPPRIMYGTAGQPGREVGHAVAHARHSMVPEPARPQW